jgi:hypothetical protein
MMATNFPLTLEGSAQEWIMTLDTTVLIDWEKVSELFQRRYADNSKRGNDKKELKNFCMREGETFTDFVKRWKDKVAQTLERPSKDEEMDMFLNNLKPFYFHKMVCGGYSGFDSLMAAGLRIEECLRMGTMKDDTPASGTSHRYRASTSGNAAKASPPANAVSNITWASQPTQSPPTYVNVVGETKNGGQRYKKEPRPPRNYDVLPDTQANIFKLLREKGVIKPLENWQPRILPLPANWEYGKFCDYHNYTGHTTNDCYILKEHP